MDPYGYEHMMRNLLIGLVVAIGVVGILGFVVGRWLAP